jgi:uncharacterized protein (TIGR03067 family)
MVNIRCHLALAVALLAPLVARADDAKDMEGVWVPIKGEVDEKPMPDESLKATTLTITKDKYVVVVGDSKDAGTCKLDPTKKPRQLDVTSTEGVNKGKTFLAIYELDGDTLTVCYGLDGKTRPTEFKTQKGSTRALMTYKRKK